MRTLEEVFTCKHQHVFMRRLNAEDTVGILSLGCRIYALGAGPGVTHVATTGEVCRTCPHFSPKPPEEDPNE